METANVGKESRGTCRTVGKDMDFIADVVRVKRASAGRVGDVLIGRAGMPVGREGFTLGTMTQEIGSVWVGAEEAKGWSEGGRREERDVRSKTSGVCMYSTKHGM